MAVTWRIGKVDWEAVEGSATDVRLTLIHWTALEEIPNPDFPGPNPEIPEPETLSGVKTGVIDFSYDEHIFTRDQIAAVTESQVITFVKNKLGNTRVAKVEAEVADDVAELTLPTKGHFVPAPDP